MLEPSTIAPRKHPIARRNLGIRFIREVTAKARWINSRTMTIVEFNLSRVSRRRRIRRVRQILDQGVVIEIEGGQLATVEFDFESVEPQPIALGMGVPGAGLGLAISNHDALDGSRPDLMGLGNLLSHPYTGSGIEY